MKLKFGVLALVFLLAAWAATAPTSNTIGASDAGSPELICLLPTNCVNSRGTGDLVPLRYTGTPARAVGI